MLQKIIVELSNKTQEEETLRSLNTQSFGKFKISQIFEFVWKWKP